MGNKTGVVKTRSRTVKFENWHTEETAIREGENLPPLKHPHLPKKFEPGFLAKLDQRTEVFQLLKTAYGEITGDMGGVEALSHTQRVLAEKFCFLEFVLRGIEQKIVTNPKSSEVAVILSRWIQGLNSLTGLARIIGLERRARQVTNLKQYIKERVK